MSQCDSTMSCVAVSTGSCTTDTVVNVLMGIMNKVGIEYVEQTGQASRTVAVKKLVSITTDGAANMLNIAPTFSVPAIHCVAHTLNLVAKKALDDEEMKHLVETVSTLMTWFVRRRNASKLLRAIILRLQALRARQVVTASQAVRESRDDCELTCDSLGTDTDAEPPATASAAHAVDDASDSEAEDEPGDMLPVFMSREPRGFGRPPPRRASAGVFAATVAAGMHLAPPETDPDAAVHAEPSAPARASDRRPTDRRANTANEMNDVGKL